MWGLEGTFEITWAMPNSFILQIREMRLKKFTWTQKKLVAKPKLKAQPSYSGQHVILKEFPKALEEAIPAPLATRLLASPTKGLVHS